MAPPAGLAHVGTVSFLAARIAPAGSFWLSLSGGAALARESELRGLRAGYASSTAAMLQTVALVGPLRFNAPLTQALSAPLLGAMHARGSRPTAQFAACLAIRVLHYTVLTAFALFVLLGPKGYAGSYSALFGWLPLPDGLAGALILTAITNGTAAIFFSIIQTWFYRDALLGWPERSPKQPVPRPAPVAARLRAGAIDPRVALVVASLITAVLLVSHSWPVLAAVAAWLAAAMVPVWSADRDVLRVGLALALVLALGTLFASVLGGLGPSDAASRAVRAALLVMVPTWMRLAAGSAGLREAFRRMLLRLGRLPGAHEAGELLSELDSGPLLLQSAKVLGDHLRGVRRRPLPVAGALLTWVVHEAESLPSRAATDGLALRIRLHDAALAVSVLVPAAALAAIALPV